MNIHTKWIEEALNVSTEEALEWQERIAIWEDFDWSEWSEKKINREIKAFVGAWNEIYSKVAV